MISGAALKRALTRVEPVVKNGHTVDAKTGRQLSSSLEPNGTTILISPRTKKAKEAANLQTAAQTGTGQNRQLYLAEDNVIEFRESKGADKKTGEIRYGQRNLALKLDEVQARADALDEQAPKMRHYLDAFEGDEIQAMKAYNHIQEEMARIKDVTVKASSESDSNFHIDHMWARKLFGMHFPGNFRMAEAIKNIKKSDTPLPPDVALILNLFQADDAGMIAALRAYFMGETNNGLVGLVTAKSRQQALEKGADAFHKSQAKAHNAIVYGRRAQLLRDRYGNGRLSKEEIEMGKKMNGYRNGSNGSKLN